MSEKSSGKLRYINGIPYLSGQHIQIDPGPMSRSERWLAAWQGLVGPRLAGPMLIFAIVLLVVGVGGLIDYVFFIMPRSGQ